MAGMVKAGSFRDRATFDQLSQGQIDEYGNSNTGWKQIGKRSASMVEQSGREAINGGVVSGASYATMRVRRDYLTAKITTADRVSVRGVRWAIISIIQVDRQGSVLEFILQRGVAA